VVKTS